MPRSLRRAPFVVLTGLAAMLLAIPQASAAITWSGVPSGSAGRVQNWSWDNGDPEIGGGSNGNISTILTSDTLDGMCFGTNSGKGQLGVFYDSLPSGGSAWAAPKKLNGSYNADRGALVTDGSDVFAVWSSQVQYYNASCGTYTFDTSQNRFVYFRSSTDNGATWGAAYKLPGQGTSFRGDYNYIAANGSNVYVTTTNVSGTTSGKILLWVSTNSGASFNAPITIGTTTNKDTVPGQTSGNCPCGYTGGFTGLPAVATNGSAVGIAYTANASGAEKIAICSTAGTGCTTSTVAASGANLNSGYSQAAGDSTRMVFTWTTGTGAFSDVWTGGTGGSFGGVKTIVSFPDANFATTKCGSTTGACNVAGTGAIPVLLGSSGIGISLSECNGVGGVKCDESQTVEKSREILVWYESSNNGGTYGTHSLIQAPTSAKNTYMNEFGSIANIGGVPYVLDAGHDDIYSGYQVVVRSCSGC